MKTVGLTLSILLAMLLLIHCKTPNTVVTNNQQVKEKALSGSGFSTDKDISINYTLASNGLADEIISVVKTSKGYYEATHTMKNMTKTLKLEPQEVENLIGCIQKNITDEYYKENVSNSNDLNNEWHLDIKQPDTEFFMHGKNVNPNDYLPVALISSQIDLLLAYASYSSNTTASNSNSFPKGSLVSFSYSVKGSMRPGGPEWKLSVMEDGKYKLTYRNDQMAFNGEEPEIKEIICEPEVGNDILQFLKDGNAHNYNSYYSNPGVTDGSRWSLDVRFSSGKTISSSGYMAGPKDESAIDNSINYLNNLLKDN